MKYLDMIVFEEFMATKGRLEPGSLRKTLEIIGIVDAEGRFVDDERLGRMLRLADAPTAEQSTVLQLPSGNPLRSFYENVLAKQDNVGMEILELVRKHLNQQKQPVKSQRQRETPAPREGFGLGSALFEQFINSDFSGGSLGRPSHRPQPERIVWPVRLDLGAGLEAGLSETERQKHQAYQILMDGKPDAADKIINLGVAPSSIPAMKAWLSRCGVPPPLLPSLFQLHVGKSKLRANLFCCSKSHLLNAFTERFRQAAAVVAIGSDVIIDGPPPGQEVQRTFSAARIWNIQDPAAPTNKDEAIKFTFETWEVIKRVSQACGAK